MCVCVCVYEQELVLNNLQELICHKIQPTNQPTNHPPCLNLYQRVLVQK